MTHYLALCKRVLVLAVLLLTLSPTSLASAEAGSYSELYIAIGDGIMASKENDTVTADAALIQFTKTWNAQQHTGKESIQVDQALKDAQTADSTADRLEALTALSKAVHVLEQAENPADEQADRLVFKQAIMPALNDLGSAIQTGDIEKIKTTEKAFLSVWTRNERPVREQDIVAYGTIETQMAFLRIALAKETPDQVELKQTYDALKKAITSFAAGEKLQETLPAQGGSLNTLTSLLAKTRTALMNQDGADATEKLREFITIWPNVEGEIRTKDATLYTDIENQVPLFAGELTKDTANFSKISVSLEDLQQRIELVKDTTSYTFWDSALILLREGLEALLIIIGLTAFLRKAKQPQLVKWIYLGVVVGTLVSLVTAILMITLLNSVTIGSSREIMEGVIGLSAAMMMIGIGAWLHRKSSITAWNDYVARQIGTAVSTRSAWAIGILSFLTVFREGAETVIFYVGIAPNMEVSQFVVGIVVALVILVAVAVLLVKAGNRIPLHRLFAVATVFIYALAFKIIGVSIHKLQLTDVITSSVIGRLPVLSSIGFYPTWETISAQLVLVLTIVIIIAVKKF